MAPCRRTCPPHLTHHVHNRTSLPPMLSACLPPWLPACAGQREQAAAFVLLLWLLAGWLLPSLLLLPRTASHQGRSTAWQPGLLSAAAAVGDQLEAALRVLRYGPIGGPRIPWPARTWFVTIISWALCCVLGPALL